MSTAHIVVLPGDGIGPEVTGEAVKTLHAVAECWGHTFTFEEHPIGGVSIEAHGEALTAEVLHACRAADAILLGAVGDPRYDDPSATVRPEQGLLGLRRGLDLFANLRPVMIFPQVGDASPLRPNLLEGVDILFVRELTSGIYFGQPRRRDRTDGHDRAIDTMAYDATEIERVVRLACRLARDRRGQVTSVDKANILETSRLWRQVATAVAAEFPDVTLEHQLVDSMAMRLITAPAGLDVVVTGNMFGDILSDEASVLAGSLGMLPSAALGAGPLGLYEPVHGSAPDIAGEGAANPIATILSAAMLLRSSLGLLEEAAAVESAVRAAMDDGLRTRDLGGTTGTAEMGEAIRRHLKQR